MEAAPLSASTDAAWARFRERGLPARDEEIWKYSRVFGLDLDDFAPATTPPPAVVPVELDAIDFAVGAHAALVLVRDGFVVHTDLSPAAHDAGLTVEVEPDSPINGGAGLDAFAELNAAMAPTPLVVSVRAGAVVEEPVVVLQWSSSEGAVGCPRLTVRAERGSQVTVVDYQGSDDDVHALSVPVVELDVADGAVVRYLGIENLGRRVWQIGRQLARVGAQATVMSANVALGGDYARLQVDVMLDGEGANADLVAVYFGDGEQMHDFRTLQEHRGRHTTSDLLFKGAVTELAHAVYTGLIRVNEGAAGTSAFLTNRNIVLSEGARAYSTPNLEIVNENDLRNCGHASASGPIDDDQLFYLESRGIPRDTAERLIVLGFFDDILQRTPLPALRSRLRDAVTRKLDRTLA